MSYLFVANWKMYLHISDVVKYCTTNNNELKKLNNEHSLVLCTSIITLPTTIELLNNREIKIGAQDCSPFKNGAYTGQVSAKDIAQAGCTYCIIGHSERRILCGETNETIAQKAKQLIENNIIPIICIGEISPHCILTETYIILENQLSLIFTILQNELAEQRSLIIAYEPVWAIGAKIIPDHTYLNRIFDWLKKILAQKIPHSNISLLYGGGVTSKTISQLKKITNLNGFLIGKASTDFQQFKSIIQS